MENGPVDSEDDASDDADRRGAKRRVATSRPTAGVKKRKKNRAPTEMSSRKAVTRYRVVVPNSEVSRIRKRDPRFDSLSGKLNRGHWETAYSFIDEYKQDELARMRQAAGRARSKKDREAYESITQELSREQNRVAERERWKRRRALVQAHRQSERHAIVSGEKKTPDFLSKARLRKAELEAKFADLKKAGKLDKFMQKRRKKNASKDRKRMPRNFN